MNKTGNVSMNHRYRTTLMVLAFIFMLTATLKAQNPGSDWFSIPGFVSENPLVLNDEISNVVVLGAAVLSYTLAEFIFKEGENLNFYQARIGMNKEYFWGLRKLHHQNFGIENRVAPWFAFALETSFQQWNDITPNIEDEFSFGLGAGLMSYYRWYLFGKKKLSPFMEYGTGFFYGAENFPFNGTNFTFNHSTQFGLEYTFKNNNKIRVTYGYFNQSNHALVQPNPGYDADGFSISYSWFWKNSSW